MPTCLHGDARDALHNGILTVWELWSWLSYLPEVKELKLLERLLPIFILKITNGMMLNSELNPVTLPNKELTRYTVQTVVETPSFL